MFDFGNSVSFFRQDHYKIVDGDSLSCDRQSVEFRLEQVNLVSYGTEDIWDFSGKAAEELTIVINGFETVDIYFEMF